MPAGPRTPGRRRGPPAGRRGPFARCRRRPRSSPGGSGGAPRRWPAGRANIESVRRTPGAKTSGWRKSAGTAMRGHSAIHSTCDQAESWRSRSQDSDTAIGPAWARLAPGPVAGVEAGGGVEGVAYDRRPARPRRASRPTRRPAWRRESARLAMSRSQHLGRAGAAVPGGPHGPWRPPACPATADRGAVRGRAERDLVEQRLVLARPPTRRSGSRAPPTTRAGRAAGSGTVASSTCSAAQVPEGRGRRAPGPSGRPPGPVGVVEEGESGVGHREHRGEGRRCGSWIIAAPESSSTCRRSDAASPGRASVPDGRGLAGRPRNSV